MDRLVKVTVVGLGLIGGSVALDLKKSGFAAEVVGADSNSVHCREALQRRLIDRVDSLEAGIENADLLVLAVPVNAICELLPKILDKLCSSATVTDVGSTKELIVELVRGHKRRKQFVPGHPMAGTEHSGPNAALSGLFRGKAAVICDSKMSGPEHLKKVEEMYDALGAKRVYMDSKEHDMHAAFVSHLSHISSFVLANTVLAIEKNVATIFDLASGGFESTVRLAKSSPSMWVPIFEQNRNYVLKALDAYVEHLQEFRTAVVEKDWQRAHGLLDKANEIRRVLNAMKTETQK